MKIGTESSHQGRKNLWTDTYYLWDVPSEREGPSWLQAVYFHLHNHAAEQSCGRDVFPFCHLDPGKRSPPVSSWMGKYSFLHGLFRVNCC